MQELPLDLAWPEIRSALESHQNLVLVAEPGAGKTTRFPPRLLEMIEGTVLMLEPRRLAARASAARIASEQGWELGREVGYQVRFENRTSAKTRLRVLTEGLLGRRLQSDPELSGVTAVILDEFHERSQHTDLALGLLFELQQLSRPDLRIIVMSATLDAEAVSRYLNDAPIVSVPGRTYPVSIHHGLKPLLLESGPPLFDRVADAVLNCVEGALPRLGDLLVFLPGTREIRGVRERITDRCARAGFDVVELHGSLSLEDQDRALRRSGSRVVLATNIAETSLTLEGIGTVIDSGLARVARSDAAGFTRLGLSRISLASATQRAGRAGRTSEGICHRLWSRLDENSMPGFEAPEILRTDLSEPLMLLMAQGTRDPESFSWFERPLSSALRSAMRTLEELGFQRGGELTPEGRNALRLPVDARPAKLVLESIRAGALQLGSELAALVTERDIVMRSADLRRQASIESDVMLRYHLLHENSRDVDRFAKQTCLRAAEQIERVARDLGPATATAPAPAPAQARVPAKPVGNVDELGQKLLLRAYPDRLARRRRAGDGAARMIGGKGIRLAPFSSVERAEFFVAIDSMEHLGNAKNEVTISIASQVERSWIEEAFASFITEKTETVFDAESKQVLEQTARFLRDLPLNQPHAKRAHPDKAHAILVEACLQNWDVWFAQRDDIASIEQRLRFVKAEGAREAFLEEACFNETKLDDVLSKALAEIYLRHLPPETQKLLRNEAPDRITVPSGSDIKVHYPPTSAPYIEVRIQELFGWTKSPLLAGIPLQLHLLGPNYRPMQVTSDLASFWANGYPEVRKELRARYPKHSWPDDPLTAKPEAKGRRRQ